jgi:hypothetical protein
VSDIKKPLATLELASAAVSLLKTAAVIFVMMALEWSRLKERKAELQAAGAENDLEIEKLKAKAAADTTSAAQSVDSFLSLHGLGAGKPYDPDSSGGPQG